MEETQAAAEPDAATPAGRLALLAAVAARQAGIVELSAIGIAEDTFAGDQQLNVMAVTLARASGRLARLAGRITEALTENTTTTGGHDDDTAAGRGDGPR